MSIGDLHAEKHETGAALDCFAQGRNSFERFLAVSPEDDDALANIGRLFLREGEILSKTAAEQAIDKFRQAIESLESALSHAAEDAEARNDKGKALHRLGQLYLVVGRRDEARKTLRNAISEYDHGLAIAPDHKVAKSGRTEAAALLAGMPSPADQ